jgi:hypothetical protein
MKNTNKLIIFFLFISITRSFSQDDQLNLKKYWFYRYRLMNDFMVKGPNCQGCSEIINERDHNSDKEPVPPLVPIAKWGDQSFNLGAYIGILATEYKLLHDRGQPVDTTLQELCFAMRAFNRLDQTAEHHYAVTQGHTHSISAGDLNGFFIRDDVPVTFLNDHPQLKNGTVATHFVDSVASDYWDAVADSPNYVDKNFLMSHDQIYPILMGMSLVREYLYNGLSYNNYPLNDVNGNTNIWKEAEDISNRMINNLYHPTGIYLDWSVVNPFFAYPFWSPPILNPYENIQGSEVGVLAYGVSEAGCYIKNVNDNLTAGYPVHKCDDYIHGSSYNLAPVWNEIGKPTTAYASNHYEDFKPEIVATIGNSWWTEVYPTFPNPVSVITHILSLHWVPSWQDVISVVQASAGLPVNVTENELYLRAKHRNNEWMPLLRMLLHGGGTGGYHASDYQELLDQAPCDGPYNFSASGGGMSTYEWSSRDRLHSSDERGGYGYTGSPSNGNGSSQGEYPGLDYMLYYNLYAIAYGPGTGVGYSNYMDRKVTETFPLTVGGTTYGISSSPRTTIEAFNTIDAYNTVNSNAIVDYRAGREIHLGAGFHAISGCDFHAYVDPFKCVNGEYRLASTSNDSSNDDGMQNAVAYLGPTTFVKYPPVKEKPNYETEEGQNSISQNTGNYAEIKNSALPASPSAKVSEIRIQPNPNNGSFEVVISTSEKINSKLTLLTIFGNVILQQQITSAVTNIDISGQAKGIYYVKIESEKGIKMEKVIYQ